MESESISTVIHIPEPNNIISQYLNDEFLKDAVERAVGMYEKAIRGYGLDDGSPSSISIACLTNNRHRIPHEVKLVTSDDIYEGAGEARKFFESVGETVVEQGSLPMGATTIIPVDESGMNCRVVIVARNVNRLTRNASIYVVRTPDGEWELERTEYDYEIGKDISIYRNIDALFEASRRQKSIMERDFIIKNSRN